MDKNKKNNARKERTNENRTNRKGEMKEQKSEWRNERKKERKTKLNNSMIVSSAELAYPTSASGIFLFILKTTTKNR